MMVIQSSATIVDPVFYRLVPTFEWNGISWVMNHYPQAFVSFEVSLPTPQPLQG
jgi:hypothetical protein